MKLKKSTTLKAKVPNMIFYIYETDSGYACPRKPPSQGQLITYDQRIEEGRIRDTLNQMLMNMLCHVSSPNSFDVIDRIRKGCLQ